MFCLIMDNGDLGICSPTHRDGHMMNGFIWGTALYIICLSPHLSVLKQLMSCIFRTDQNSIN